MLDIYFTFALVSGPKYPVGLMPTLAWYLAKAALVAGPNLVISNPGDPAPVMATLNPLEFRNCCKALTSSPIEPRVRLRLKDALGEALRKASSEAGMLSPAAFFC